MVKSRAIHTHPVVTRKKRQLAEYAQAVAKARREGEKGRVAQLMPPEGEYTTDPQILMNAHTLWIMSGKQMVMSEQFLHELPIGYVPDLFRLETLIQYYEDSAVFNAGWRGK